MLREMDEMIQSMAAKGRWGVKMTREVGGRAMV